MVLIPDDMWNYQNTWSGKGWIVPVSKREPHEKSNECSMKFHTVQHKGGLQLLSSLDGKKKVFSNFDLSNCNTPQMLLPFCPLGNKRERARSVFSVHLWYCTWGKALDSIYYFPFLHVLFPHPKYLLKPLFFLVQTTRLNRWNFK